MDMSLEYKFLFDYEAMTIDELERYLTQLKENDTHIERIAKINRRLRSHYDRSESEFKQQEEWMKLAKEDKAIKEKWLVLGCEFKNVESLTKWYYKEQCFYKWYSLVNIDEEIIKVRKANDELKEIINKERKKIK